MEELFLDVELRNETGRGKVKDIRGAGFIPAVVYAQGKDTQAIKISRSKLLHLIEHRIENVVVNLNFSGAKKARPCLIKEIQYDPVLSHIVHIDFNEISLTKAIKVNVPVVSKGEPMGVKQEGGSLEHILWEIEIECLPTNIPKEIEVDVSNLVIGNTIHIKDIGFPPNVKVLSDPEAVVFSVAAPMKEEVAVEPVEGEEKKEPEVIKEKKEEPGEEKEEEKKEKEKK